MTLPPGAVAENSVGDPLPSFRHPPVTEVALSVAFKALPLTVPQLGLLWTRFQSEFPLVEEHPAYEPPTELLEGNYFGPPISVELLPTPPLPRLWFLSKDLSELLQLQRNWFACNWRKVQPDAKYGRWPSRWGAFNRWFGVLEKAVEDEGLGVLTCHQCEITYVNHISPGKVWRQHGDLHKILRVSRSPKGKGGFLPAPERAQFATSFLLESQGNKVGRLHVTVQPGLRKEDSFPIFVMTLTARGAPIGSSGIEGVHGFMELAHEWIVRGFTDLTTDAMHEEWGRYA